MRVFLDTNVLATGLATRGLCADVVREVIVEHELVRCDQVLRELKRVLTTKFRLPTEKVSSALSLLERFELAPAPSGRLTVRVRDQDDQAILAAAVAAGAEVLVSGDADLLTIGCYGKMRIVNPRGFWEIVRKVPRKGR